MSAGGRARWLILMLALAASVGAALYVSQTGPDAVTTAQAAPLRARAAPVAVQEAAPVWRAPLGNAVAPMEIFAQPETQAPQAAAPVAAAPRTPALRVIGAMREDGEVIVFLSDGKNGHAVSKGDTVNERYRVQTIAPPAMTLLDLRTRRRIRLQIGALP